MNKERNCQARQCDYQKRNDKSTKQTELKKLTSLHDRIAEQLDDVLNGRKVIAEWMTLGKKKMCLKTLGMGYPLCGICRQAGWFRKARTTS